MDDVTTAALGRHELRHPVFLNFERRPSRDASHGRVGRKLPPVPARREGMHSRVYALALRLLLGEQIDLVDEHGRRWIATATVLSYSGGPVVEGTAYDVAARLAALVPRARS